MTPRRSWLDVWTALRVATVPLPGSAFWSTWSSSWMSARSLGLVASIGWHLVPLLAVYAGCQASRAAALWLCQPQGRTGAIHARARRPRVGGGRSPSHVCRSRARRAEQGLAAGTSRSQPGRRGIAAIVAELIAHSVIATTLSIGALAYLINAYEVDPVVRTPALLLIWTMSGYVVGAVVAIGFRIHLIGAVAGLLHRTGQLRSVTEPEPSPKNGGHAARRPPGPSRPVDGDPRVPDRGERLPGLLEAWIALAGMGFDVPWHYPLVIEGAMKFVSVAFFFVPTQVGRIRGCLRAHIRHARARSRRGA